MQVLVSKIIIDSVGQGLTNDPKCHVASRAGVGLIILVFKTLRETRSLRSRLNFPHSSSKLLKYISLRVLSNAMAKM
jgi:hypothetical protein